MKMKTMKTVVRYLLVLPLLFLVSSCSDEDYLNVIPDNSTALVAIDAQKLFDGNVDGVLGKALNQRFQTVEIWRIFLTVCQKKEFVRVLYSMKILSLQ